MGVGYDGWELLDYAEGIIGCASRLWEGFSMALLRKVGYSMYSTRLVLPVGRVVDRYSIC